MKKVGVLILIVILISIIVFAFIKYNTQISLAVQTPKQLLTETEEFENAVITGTPTTCIFSKRDSLIEYSINGKKTFTKTVSFGKTTYFLGDESAIYIWGEGQNFGSKFSLANIQEGNLSMDPTIIKNNYKSLTANNYKIICNKLIKISETFMPPINISFSVVN